MGIHLEPVIFLMRKGEELQKYGDKYDTVGTLVKVADDTLLVKGVVGKFTILDFRNLKAQCAAMGFTNLIWERKK